MMPQWFAYSSIAVTVTLVCLVVVWWFHGRRKKG